ncbi:MAG: hypothetical protein WA979_04975 [Pacificimonas sp.]
MQVKNCREKGRFRGNLRVLDLDARNDRKVESLPPDLLDNVLARVVTIFE